MRELMQQHAVAVVLGAFGLGILLIILAISRGVAAARRRKAQIRDWAFRNGYEYIEGPIPAWEVAPIAKFRIDENTTSADAFNVVRSARIILTDVRRTAVRHFASHGNQTEHTTRSGSCALFKLASPLPAFSFSALSAQGPDSFQGKLLGGVAALAKYAAGGDLGTVVDMENRPGFLLTSHQPEAAGPLFAAGRARFFDDKCGWSAESDGSWLLVHCDPTIYGLSHGWPRTSTVDGEHYDEFATIARAIHDHLTQRSDEFSS